MAMLNEILGVAARFNQHLTRKFGVTGGAPSPQLTPEIAPVFPIEHGAEGHILQSEYMATGVLSVAAVGAKKSAAGLFNPLGSNVVLVVSQIDYSSNANSTVSGGVFKFPSLYSILPAAGGVSYRDTRVPVDPAGSTATKQPVGIVRADNDPPTLPGVNLFQRVVLANSVVTYNESVVLAPGWAVAMYQGTVNLLMDCGFSWIEIPLAHGEVGPF